MKKLIVTACMLAMVMSTLTAVSYTHLEGYLTVLGAPNILLGGSHSGNLSALQAIREKAADVLVSDYYPQSLLYAVT